jgi:hypothetical protein
MDTTTDTITELKPVRAWEGSMQDARSINGLVRRGVPTD